MTPSPAPTRGWWARRTLRRACESKPNPTSHPMGHNPPPFQPKANGGVGCATSRHRPAMRRGGGESLSLDWNARERGQLVEPLSELNPDGGFQFLEFSKPRPA